MKEIFVLAKNPFDLNTEIAEDFTSFRFKGEVHCGDNYHTIDELYEHRHTLFCALTKLYDNYLTPIGTRVKCFKSKQHHPNNDAMMDGWFIVWMEVNKLIGPSDIISYHLPMEWWDKFKLMEMKFAPIYDGYGSDDVLKRIMML